MSRVVIIAFMLAGCAQFPALEGTISDALRDAPYPALTPVPPAPAATGDEADALNARIAALKARAALIRQIDIAALQ